MMNAILEVEKLEKSYQSGKQVHKVLDQVSFSLKSGECLGLVGESGCGKTTLAQVIAGLEKADRGTVSLAEGKRLHMVFQNPVDSFNPRMRLGEAVMEGMIRTKISRKERLQKMQKLLAECGLAAEYAGRYPHQVSGGECQRAALARALASGPELLICDEATSALDAVVQSQLLNLIRTLIKNRGLSVLFICHDPNVVEEICDRILVMDQGRIVEERGK